MFIAKQWPLLVNNEFDTKGQEFGSIAGGPWSWNNKIQTPEGAVQQLPDFFSKSLESSLHVIWRVQPK